jgi:hypothetical protein
MVVSTIALAASPRPVIHKTYWNTGETRQPEIGLGQAGADLDFLDHRTTKQEGSIRATMATLKSTRLAWSVAIASLALWATSVPVTWGQVAAGAARYFDENDSPSTSTSVDDAGAAGAVCPPTPQIAIIPPAVTAPSEPNPPAADSTTGQEGTFHLCGGDMQPTAQAIEQLIAGRSFSASLSARGDGCADLTIRVASQQKTNGTASSRLNVSLGSGQNLSIQIVSANGMSHVSIGQG